MKYRDWYNSEVVDKLSLEGQEEAQKQYESSMEETKASCLKLEEHAKAKELEVVSRIVERVKSSVN